MTPIEKQISELGWELETDGHWVRASHGRFHTLWHPTPEEVLADVRQIKNDKPK